MNILNKGKIYVLADDISVDDKLKPNTQLYLCLSEATNKFGVIGTKSVVEFSPYAKLIRIHFSKSDLEAGDVVILRNGNKFLVTDRYIVNKSNFDLILFDNYTDDLKCNKSSLLDIVEVCKYDESSENYYLVWKRITGTAESTNDSVVDMTIKEIETALGHKVRIVR